MDWSELLAMRPDWNHAGEQLAYIRKELFDGSQEALRVRLRACHTLEAALLGESDDPETPPWVLARWRLACEMHLLYLHALYDTLPAVPLDDDEEA